ncbi:MAG: hypothetical protein AB7P22_03890 [Vicinamibacterales bacterium]
MSRTRDGAREGSPANAGNFALAEGTPLASATGVADLKNYGRVP